MIRTSPKKRLTNSKTKIFKSLHKCGFGEESVSDNDLAKLLPPLLIGVDGL
ncbi:MAG: hypothetical protein K5660_04810 [Paludibacteraceae bacterium]|nr:hypothetical protein [Paludibacteraceae bacterium]